MNTKDTTHSLELSLLPAVLASSCCLTVPALALLGISFSENFFYEYRWLLRLLGFITLVFSLIWYFKKHGVSTREKYKKHADTVIAISIQTLIFALLFYLLFLYVIVPVLCDVAQLTSCNAVYL